MRRNLLRSGLVASLALVTAAMAQDLPGAVGTGEHPLEPADTSSPRASLQTFMNEGNAGWRICLRGGHDARSGLSVHAVRAERCLDDGNVAPARNSGGMIGAGQIPPVNAFWSIAMYDAEGYFVKNAIHRYSIGDRDKLDFNNDGSLDIHIQHESPGKDQESNWLPAPAGDFNLVMRLYWPRVEVLTAAWNPPPVRNTR